MASWWLIAVLAFVLPSAAGADDLGDVGDDYWDVIETTSIKELMALDGIARFEDNAPLWDYQDASLQQGVDQALADLGLDDEARKKQLSVALVDLSGPGRPRAASVNGDVMMYAASLPKIAVLLAAFEKIAQGKMTLDEATEFRLTRMIKASSNRYATEMMHKVGKEYIARVLLSPRYRLYDPEHNGGLWVGKDYAKAGLWRSHGATAMQVARFYYLLVTDNLVTPEHSRKMREILAGSELNHKFVRALRQIDPEAAVSRKSGSWSTFHSDSVLVERDGHRYIAVVLSNNSKGSQWLGRIITKLDALLDPDVSAADQRPISANQAAR
ncbi:MAG: serine hydrolase [Deltaproteobacteria bacterium]|nr:serine hydrolase [Deltaproteobacteria bacterium]